MAFQPGLPGSQFPSEDALIRRIQDLEKAVQQLAAANPFAPMGITPTANGFTVTGNETVNGSLTVNGPAKITGTLDLPAGIIGNAALANPITTGSAGVTQQSFTLTTTAQTFAQQNITVPNGYTQALVMNGVSGNGWNNNATAGYLYVASMINGSAGGYVIAPASGSGLGFVSCFGIRTLTGLTGGSTISVGVSMYVDAGTWAASVSNSANTNALVLFLR